MTIGKKTLEFNKGIPAGKFVNDISDLKIGMTVHDFMDRNSDGTPRRYKVTSIKTWKRSDRIKIGLKYGMYDHFYIDNLDVIRIPE